MSDNQFGFLTASYTIGGFLSSVYASKLAGSRGEQNNLLLSAISIGIGSLLTSLSNFFTMILIGRTIVGIGCGINTFLVLIYHSEISPSQTRGSVGVMNQLAIVFVIFGSQLVSLPLAKLFPWRWIFIISSAFSTLQVITSPLVLNQKDQSSLHSDHLADLLDLESNSIPYPVADSLHHIQQTGITSGSSTLFHRYLLLSLCYWPPSRLNGLGVVGIAS
ncbi:hypothetical protein PGT21_012541 [Puccinia graminis f. sp. tritici]|uniref:Major facilitator superfamily (MFS) profile domain-containing protein n=1 Tax=Puccinia graminis f. sp. tritici TaxID=56615 RepID=A0A5B0LZ48_PUCGR|nr:hypothetical protein PGT21_012541 [Puccinia graminis f. sp. tritici]KAA1123563.1 hypothetical protein PGTUg99_011641 [Puccinia graminis f. sp. tritici]